MKTVLPLLALLLCMPLHADEVLRDQVLAGLAKQPQKHFRFVQEKQLAMLDKPLVTEGELHVSGERRVTWDIRKPYVMRYDIDGDTIRETDAQGERVLNAAGNPLAAALGEAMAAAFSGQWQGKEHLATVAAEGTAASWTLRITPHASALQQLLAAIEVQGEQQQILSVQIRESNGDRTLIRLQTLP